MRGYYGYGGYPPMYPQQGLGVRGVLIVTAIIIALIVGIFIYAKVQAAKSLKEELPSSYADEQYSTEESKHIRYLSTAIQTDLSGWNFYHDQVLYADLISSSDRLFEGVAVDYKRITGNTLRADIEGDKMSFKTIEKQGLQYDAIMQRLNSLQIA
jgi:hypothetical protein